jgi:hypothetical protein
MGYKMKRGAAPKFKELGSSPAKQVESNYPKGFNYMGDSWPDKTPGYESTKVAKQVKHKQSFDKFQSQTQKAKEFVKNLKTKGDLVSSKKSTGVNPGKGWGLNKKGDPKAPKVKTEIGFDLNYEQKKLQNQKLAKVTKKPASRLGRITKALSRPSIKNVGKIIKTVKTLAKNPFTPTGVAMIAGEAIASKASKATVKGLKKRAKSGNVNIGRKL